MMLALDSSPQSKAKFAGRLRSIMHQRGLSAAETARQMIEHLPECKSISRASVSHYCNGRAIPRLRHLEALSLALGVEQSELINAQRSGARTPKARPNGFPNDSPNAKRQKPQEAQMDASDVVKPAEPARLIDIEDFGDEVRLKIDLRVPWDIALKILDALKRKKVE